MSEDSRFSHKIYNNDPLLYKSYVGKEVRVLVEDGNSHDGIVYTVDPVSESVVLLQGDQKSALRILFGHSIKSISVLSEKTIELTELFTNMPTILQSAIEERRSVILQLLKENRFDVKEEKNILTIENVLSIKPPYEISDCVCENSIILGRIQTLLASIK